MSTSHCMSAEVLSSSRGQAMFSGQCRVHNWRTVIEADSLSDACYVIWRQYGHGGESTTKCWTAPPPQVLGSLTMVNHIAPSSYSVSESNLVSDIYRLTPPPPTPHPVDTWGLQSLYFILPVSCIMKVHRIGIGGDTRLSST